MPFEKANISALINDKLDEDIELKEMWNNSRMEYAILGELIKIRKEQGLSLIEKYNLNLEKDANA